MANHYISKEMTDRLYATMKRKNVSTNQICKELNIAYPDFKAMLEGRQPCFNKWQKKIANVLGVERAELFKEMAECETCKELNEEPNAVFIDGIYIMTAGYYHWRREILYCPTCGKRITHIVESEGK